MPEANARFVGSIPELYDRHLGPVMFEPYADDLVKRIPSRQTGPVLEVACGTGIVTSKLRAHLDRGVHLVASDLNEPMTNFARAKSAGEGDIEWRQADAAALPFTSASFASVVCQFGVMFIPPEKKLDAFREMRRVLIPGGLLAFNVWGSREQNPFARVAFEVISGFFPVDPPSFYKIPFGMYDTEMLRHLVDDAGFHDVQIETVDLIATCDSARSFATGLVKGNPLITAIEERGASADAIIEATAAALVREGGDNPYRSTMQAVVVTARA